MKKKINKNKWMIPKSIKFDKKKLALADRKKLLKQLPKKCREQLDIILNDARQTS